MPDCGESPTRRHDWPDKYRFARPETAERRERIVGRGFEAIRRVPPCGVVGRAKEIALLLLIRPSNSFITEKADSVAARLRRVRSSNNLRAGSIVRTQQSHVIRVHYSDWERLGGYIIRRNLEAAKGKGMNREGQIVVGAGKQLTSSSTSRPRVVRPKDGRISTITRVAEIKPTRTSMR